MIGSTHKKRGILVTLILLIALCAAACTPKEEVPPPQEDANTEEVQQTASLQELLENITAEDIADTDFANFSADDLAPALQDAVANIVEPEKFNEADRSGITWTLNVSLKGENAEGGIFIVAGINENIVRISGDSEQLACESALLYNLLTSIYDIPLSLDAAALERYMPLMEERFNTRLGELNEFSPDANFTAAELRAFEAITTYDDIFDGTVYVYQTDIAYLVENIESTVFAGGMGVDSQGRVVYCDVDTIFVAAHQGDEILFSTFISREAYYGGTEEMQQQNGYEAVSQAVLEGLAEG